MKDLTFDICSMLQNPSALMLGTRLLRELYPDFLETFKEFIKPCPFMPVCLDKFFQTKKNSALFLFQLRAVTKKTSQSINFFYPIYQP
jgi:hypothetical protein